MADSKFPVGQACAICKGEFNIATTTVEHASDCPDHPAKKIAAARVASIGAARFARTDVPAHLDPRTAIEAALQSYDKKMEDGAKISHVIVIMGYDNPAHPSGSGTKFMQAGSYRHHAQMGLCLEGMEMIRDSGQ